MGEFDKKPSEVDEFGFPIPIRGIEENGEWTFSSLTVTQIRKLNTPFLAASLRLYGDFSVFKILPHGKGTMDEKQSVIEIIKILKSEENAYINWEMEQNTKSK